MIWKEIGQCQKEYFCALFLVSGTVQGLSNHIMSLNETSMTLCLQAPKKPPAAQPAVFSTAANHRTQDLVHFQYGFSHQMKQIYSSVHLAKILCLNWGKFHHGARIDLKKFDLG